MAKLSIQVAATSQTVNVFIQDSSSTTGAGLTGLVFNSASLTAYYALPLSAAVQITLATLAAVTTAWSSGGFKEIDATNMPGWYRLDIPNAALASGRFVSIHLKGATNMAPLPLEIELTGWNNQDAVRGGLTALPNANAEAAGGLYTRGTGAGQINQPANGMIDGNVVRWLGTAVSTPTVAGVPNVNAKTWNDLTTVALPLVPTTAGRTLDVSTGGEAGLDWANIGSPTTAQNLSATNIDVDQVVASVSGAVGSVTGAVGSVTGNVGGNVVGSVASVVAGVTLAASAVQAIWDALTSALTTVGSIGKLLVDNITGNAFTRLGAPVGASISADIAAVKAQVVTINADTDDIQTRLPAALVSGRIDASVGSYPGNTAQTGDNFARLGAPAGASISADIAAIEAQTDDIGVAGAGLTAVPWNAAWDAEVQSEVTDALNAYDPPTKAELDAAVAPLALEASVVAVQADTDNIQTRIPAALVSGRIDASVGAVAANAITAAAVADGAIDRATFAADTGLVSIRSSTAQAGAAGTITLDASASAVDSFYVGLRILLTGGTGAGQVRTITAYVGATKVATVDWNWVTNPDSSSTFALVQADGPAVNSSLQVATTASDPWSTALPGAYGAGTAGNIIGNRLDAAVTTRLAPTVAARTLDVSTGGEAGIDWANIGSPTTAQNLSATNIDVDQVVASVSGAVGSVTGNVGGNVTGSVGSVVAGVTLAASAVQAIWDALTSALTTVGSIGKKLSDWVIGSTQTGDSFARLGAPSGASVSADIAAVKAETASIQSDTNDIQVRLPAALVSGRMDSSVGAMAANTVNASALATDAVAEIADGVWDEAIAGHLGAGSTGAALNAAGSAGDPWTTPLPGAYGAGTAGNIIGTNVDALISSRTKPADTQAAVTTVTNLTNAPTAGDFTAVMKTSLNAATPSVTVSDKTGFSLSAAGVQAIWDALTSAMTTVGSIGKKLADWVIGSTQTGDSFARLGAPAGASVSADIAAVKAETASIQSDTNDIQTRLPAALVSGRMDTSVGAMAANVVTAAALATDAVNEIVDQVWDEVLSGHLTAGTTGAALNSASSSGDPWTTLLPGAYGSGTAGEIVGNNLNVQVSSRLAAASYTAPDNADILLIKAKTDNLPAAPAAVSNIPTAVENADALLGRNLAGGSSGGRMVKDALRPMRNKVTSVAGTLTVYQENDTTVAWTSVLTTDMSAEPIVSSDPV